MSLSSIIIILIVAFFIVQIFTSNPLEGEWSSEYSDMDLRIKSNGEAVVEWSDETFAVEDVKVTMPYTVDTNTKTFVLRKDEAAIADTVKKSGEMVEEQALRLAVENLEGSYEYNIEGEYLTLSEREYGEQMVFEKE
ncbi:MAG: hypothetical protein U0L05_08405 [Schaedlerella sp.]|nr:hypothetical protein [Schaedlerella sp.]